MLKRYLPHLVLLQAVSLRGGFNSLSSERIELTLSVRRALEPLRKGQTTAPEGKPRRIVPAEHIEQTLKELSPTVATMVRLRRIAGSHNVAIKLATDSAAASSCSSMIR